MIQRARGRGGDQTLAIDPFRQYPILTIEDGRYFVLHKDFIAAAADDGVWYTFSDAIGPCPGRPGRRDFVPLSRRAGEALKRQNTRASPTAEVRVGMVVLLAPPQRFGWPRIPRQCPSSGPGPV